MGEVLSHQTPRGVFKTLSTPPSFPVARLKQIHSAIILPVNTLTSNDQQGDGLIDQASSMQVLAICTADCLPILLLGPQGQALIHAGWRGLAAAILQNPLLTNIHPNYAYIGPGICVDHYQVRSDFAEHFPHTPLHKKGELWSFSLQDEAIRQLRQSYPGITIEQSDLCTVEEAQLWSYRQNKAQQRNWNLYLPEGIV